MPVQKYLWYHLLPERKVDAPDETFLLLGGIPPDYNGGLNLTLTKIPTETVDELALRLNASVNQNSGIFKPPVVYSFPVEGRVKLENHETIPTRGSQVNWRILRKLKDYVGGYFLIEG